MVRTANVVGNPTARREPAGTHPAEGRAFRRDVEGLRAVAVLLVVLFHAGVPGMTGGYVGVDVFFVISGFLITGLLPRLSLTAFYARRARRLLPAAALVLVLTVPAAYHWLGFLRGNTTAVDAIWSALFAANVRFAEQGTDYLAAQAAPSPLQHFWSLAVEEQFYLLWPAMLLVLGRYRVWGIGAVTAGSFLWSVLHADTWSYFSPFTRAWELGAGGLLALVPIPLPVRLRAALSWLGLCLILASALVLGPDTPFPGIAALLPVAGALLVLCGPGDGPLTVAPLQWIGRRSYSIYLWHWPILIVFAPAGVPMRLLLVLAAGLCAAAAYTWVEEPIRRSPLLDRSRPLTLALAVLLVALPIGIALRALSASPAAGPAHPPRLGAPAHVPN